MLKKKYWMCRLLLFTLAGILSTDGSMAADNSLDAITSVGFQDGEQGVTVQVTLGFPLEGIVYATTPPQDRVKIKLLPMAQEGAGVGRGFSRETIIPKANTAGVIQVDYGLRSQQGYYLSLLFEETNSYIISMGKDSRTVEIQIPRGSEHEIYQLEHGSSGVPEFTAMVENVMYSLSWFSKDWRIQSSLTPGRDGGLFDKNGRAVRLEREITDSLRLGFEGKASWIDGDMEAIEPRGYDVIFGLRGEF